MEVEIEEEIEVEKSEEANIHQAQVLPENNSAVNMERAIGQAAAHNVKFV